MDHAHPPLVALTQRTLPAFRPENQQALVSGHADFGESSAGSQRKMIWRMAPNYGTIASRCTAMT
jgi:hypothetical protein